MRSGCVRPTSPFVYIAKLRHLRMAIIRWRTLASFFFEKVVMVLVSLSIEC